MFFWWRAAKAFTIPALSFALIFATTTPTVGADDLDAPADASVAPAATLAQAPASAPPQTPDAPTAATAKPQDPHTRWRTAAIMAISVGGTLAYGHSKWWQQDGFTGSFKTVDEGWFGPGTDHGGADKLGHGMFAYAGTRLLTRAYEWAGNDPATALRLGLWTAVGTLSAVEVIDGFSREWRFSTQDAIANLAGGALAFLQETHPALDALLDVRLQYSRSSGPNGRRSFDPFGDYSGQRYLAVFKASGMPTLREQAWLRYLEFSVGYGARNFESDSRASVAPTRQLYFGVSLNLSEILRGTVYKHNTKPSRTQRVTETFFEFVQVPAAGAWRRHTLR